MNTLTRPAVLGGALRLCGYRPGFPFALTAENRRADEERAGEGPCGHCGRPELYAWPWHRPGSYRLYSVCGHCGFAVEV